MIHLLLERLSLSKIDILLMHHGRLNPNFISIKLPLTKKPGYLAIEWPYIDDNPLIQKRKGRGRGKRVMFSFRDVFCLSEWVSFKNNQT
jgi:hypothetical protein